MTSAKNLSQLTRPVLSVITPCFNSATTIDETIRSVLHASSLLQQAGRLVEHVFVDGGSTDGTVERIESAMSNYGHIRLKAQDGNGIYCAMNEGIAEAQGEYLHILNSDDIIANIHSYVDLVNRAAIEQADVILMSVVYFSRPTWRVKRRWTIEDLPTTEEAWRKALLGGQHYPHPGFIARACIYASEMFDTKYSLSADYKLMANILITKANWRKILISKQDVIGMATGGATGGLAGILRGNAQIRAINKELGVREAVALRYSRKALSVFRSRISPMQFVKAPSASATDASPG